MSWRAVARHTDVLVAVRWCATLLVLGPGPSPSPSPTCAYGKSASHKESNRGSCASTCLDWKGPVDTASCFIRCCVMQAWSHTWLYTLLCGTGCGAYMAVYTAVWCGVWSHTWAWGTSPARMDVSHESTSQVVHGRDAEEAGWGMSAHPPSQRSLSAAGCSKDVGHCFS